MHGDPDSGLLPGRQPDGRAGKQYDTEGELASQAVAHSTLSILISVPLVLSLGSTLLGI